MEQISRVALVCWLAMALSGCTKQGASTGQMPPAQVVVAFAQQEKVIETLPRVANVQANESVEIRPEVDGIIQEILFQEGQLVREGQLLVRLDETKFAATLAQTEANFRLSQTTYERSKQLYEERLISQQEFDQAAAVYQVNQANLEFARRQVRDARIVAPFEGVMGTRNISPGQFITKNTIVGYLIDLDPAKIEFQVPERFLGQIHTNQQINITVEAFPNRTFTGNVFFISPWIDPTNRTALVKAQIENGDFLLKPGMFANLELTLNIRENSVVIPEAAISQTLTNEQALVYLVDQNNQVQARKIKTGVQLVGKIEVLEGLRPGERVIVEGLQKVFPGAPVRISNPELNDADRTGPRPQEGRSQS